MSESTGKQLDRFPPGEPLPTTRGQRIWQRMLELRPLGQLSLERARLLTSSYKKTEGLPVPIRRARAFENVVNGISIRIDEEQLLVGDFAARPMWAEWYPENSVNWVMEDIKAHTEAYRTVNEELEEQKEIYQYWKDRTVEYAVLCHLSDTEKRRLLETSDKGAYVHFISGKLDRPAGYQIVDNEGVLKKGLLRIISDIEEEIDRTLVLDDEALSKVNFLHGLVTVYRAGIEYARRYARLARDMASTASGPKKLELSQIAETCDRVPAKRARSFHEAVQAVWFVHVLMYLENRINGLSPGRADEYLYPYYERDMREGRLTREAHLDGLQGGGLPDQIPVPKSGAVLSY